MQLYWLIFLLGALLFVPTAHSLRLYNATEWQTTGSFYSTSGTLYNVFKPVCPGRYRIGDVIVSSDVQLNASVVARALVCVDGSSEEITEAPSYQFGKSTGTASLLREYKNNNGNVTLVLGSVSLPLTTWVSIAGKSEGATSELSDLRGYGVITSSTCKLGSCSGTLISYADVNGPTYFKTWDALSLTGLSAYNTFLPLFRFAGESNSEYLNLKCLTSECFCESSCAHGVCNPTTGGCVCDAGWKGTTCTEDINECDTGAANCDAVGDCINTAPGYYCTCPSGYTLNSNGFTCDDINECLNGSICNSGEVCTNYAGGYQCNTCAVGQVLVNGVCKDVNVVFACGNGELDQGEECDRGLGCNVNCTCSAGFTSKNDTDCSRDCGNGILNAGEECDLGMGCLETCLCDANQGYQPANSTGCQAVYIETDPCARFSGNCSDCLAFNCLFCNTTNTCATSRVSSDCLDQCPGFSEKVIVPTAGESTPSGNVVDAMIQTVVPAVVVSVAGAVAGVVVLVVLLKRRSKKNKSKAETVRMSIQRSNSRRMTRNQSKYGIERNTINSNPDKTWEPPAESEFAEVDKMPFEMSKKLDFNVGSNQFKVGQQYTDVITITARDKKSSTSAGVPFAFHPPTTKKLKMEFNPSSGIVKKGKPVEVEVTMTMQMTTEIDVDIGLECSSEKKHSFITLHLMSELSSFIDLDEVTLEGGSAAKPVGDGAFGVVYKGKYRQQEVAVKMLKMQDMPEEMLDEFDREVDLMNKLRHKNIVQFVGASKVVGRFALVTEFIDKGNVANIALNTKTLSYAFKLRVALDAARAMFFLHENKILHRDLKLDNLLCVSTNPDDPVVAKLTDFGTSRAVSEKASNSYTVGVGTPMYMSPEILAKKPYDTKSDVFSYGVMLWILYCQKEPYKHIEHSWEIARFVMEGNREKIPKDCPSEFKELIEQCWSQEPNQRPEFQEIATRLEQMVESCNEVQPSPRSPRSKKSIK